MHTFVTADFDISVIIAVGGDVDGIEPERFKGPLQAVPELSGADIDVKVSDREYVIVYDADKQRRTADKIDIHVSVDCDVEGRIDVYSLRRRLIKVFVPTVDKLKGQLNVDDAYQSFPSIRIIEVVKECPDNTLQFRASEKPSQDVPQKRDEEKKLSSSDQVQRNGLMGLFDRKR